MATKATTEEFAKRTVPWEILCEKLPEQFVASDPTTPGENVDSIFTETLRGLIMGSSTWAPSVSAPAAFHTLIIRNVLGSTGERETQPELLRRNLHDLEKKIEAVEAKLQKGQEERVIVLRSISKEEAKQEILALFQDGQVHDYGEIAETLRLDLQTVVDLCNELEKGGVIG